MKLWITTIAYNWSVKTDETVHFNFLVFLLDITYFENFDRTIIFSYTLYTLNRILKNVVEYASD